MLSTYHFRHELRAQLAQAGKVGLIDVVINSGELCRSINNGSSWSAFCCDAMQAEIKPGDTLVLDQTNGVGMTVRYLLPRTAAARATSAKIEAD
jgi:hypothetical protein